MEYQRYRDPFMMKGRYQFSRLRVLGSEIADSIMDARSQQYGVPYYPFPQPELPQSTPWVTMVSSAQVMPMVASKPSADFPQRSSRKQMPYESSATPSNQKMPSNHHFISVSDAANSLQALARPSPSPELEKKDGDSGTGRKRPMRKCKVENCINSVVQGGLCIAHGAKRKQCKHPGCTKHVKKAGLCSAHGPARKRCETRGCPNIAVQGGLCISHGAKKRLCTHEGCLKKSRAVYNHLCKKHYDERQLERGTTASTSELLPQVPLRPQVTPFYSLAYQCYPIRS